MKNSWLIKLTIFIYIIAIYLHFDFQTSLKKKNENNSEKKENITIIEEKKKIDINFDNEIIDNKPNNIFYFVQISDLHISEFNKVGGLSHFKYLVESVLPIISPKFVFVSGDIADSNGNKDKKGPSVQKEKEWNAYNTILKKSGFLDRNNGFFWFETRGNHDSYNVFNWDSENNYFRKYSQTKTPGFHINYKTSFGTYSFIGIDASTKHGLISPFNLFGYLDRDRMDELAYAYDYSKKNNHKHIFTFCHYPVTLLKFSSTSDNRNWNDLSKQTSLFLTGHMHNLPFGSKMYAHHKQFTELEIFDLKMNGVFRIIAVDHDTISFVDNVLPMPEIPYQNTYSIDELINKPKYNFTSNFSPIVLITNPKDASMILSNSHESETKDKILSHVRVLIFSPITIESIELWVDEKKISTIDELSNPKSSFKLIGSDDSSDPKKYLPLYAMEWKGNEIYKDGNTHSMTVKVYNTNNEVGENTIEFNFSDKQERFRIDYLGTLALKSYLTTTLPILFITVFLFYQIVCGLLPFIKCNMDNSTLEYQSLDGNTTRSTNKSNILNRVFVQPLISFSSTPKLFYPFFFFYQYMLIGPIIVGNLIPSGDSFSERTGSAFIYGVLLKDQKMPLYDNYLFMLRELCKVQPILFILMVYLNHCKCKQHIITKLVIIILLIMCILTRRKIYYSMGIISLLTSPIHAWLILWECYSIVSLMINNSKINSKNNENNINNIIQSENDDDFMELNEIQSDNKSIEEINDDDEEEIKENNINNNNNNQSII